MDKALTRRQMRQLDMTYQPGFRGIAVFCMFMLYLPILVLIVFSFNANRSVSNWTEFSLDWYARALGNEGVQNAAIVSIEVAIIATILSTAIATAAALATTRVRQFKGMPAVFGVINMPLMVPEIVTAVATLSFFALLKTSTGITFGLGNLMIAHTVFCIPFAYMPIRARLEDMDLTLEHAAMDLYATPWQAFRRVTAPLLVPGIIAGAMLAFIVSFDDVIITYMVAGPGETTLPLYILGQIRRGVTPEINAVSTVLLLVSVMFVTLLFLILRKKK